MPSRRWLENAVLLLIAGVLLSGPGFAQVSERAGPATRAQAGSLQKGEDAAARLRGIVASGRLEDLRWPNFSDYRSQLISFYRPAGYQPAWLRNGEPTSQAMELIHILQDAGREGLRPEDYDASRWPLRLASLGNPHDDAHQARFEAALTVCLMRYLSDLHMGRINPQHLRFEVDVSQEKLDLPNFVRQRLVDGSGLDAQVAAVEPPFTGYQPLRDALQHYMELARRDSGEKMLDPGRLSPGAHYASITRLTSLLRLLGDLPESVTTPPDSTIYQGPLVDAVKHFQSRHGLAPTGELDSDTVAAMNVPLAVRVEQIRLNLERYRWLPYQTGQPAIMVNIPEFRLYGFNQGGQLALSMNANVGDDYDFQTPIFEKNMLYLVFRPYWYPPRGILRSEILPDLRKDPSLENNDVELVSADGKVMSSGNMTPAMFQQVLTGQLTMRQPPGSDNALGLVKFIFPNPYAIYIHDTPVSEHIFRGAQRTFSHGCIQVQEPAQLAQWLLRNLAGWDLPRVQYAMHKGPNNVKVNLAPPVPVLVVYHTAVVAENGDVHFFEDIYGHDGVLERELAKGYPYERRRPAVAGKGD